MADLMDVSTEPAGVPTAIQPPAWKEAVGAEILRQGAEAVVYTGTFQNQQCVIKERFSKTYRHPRIDEQINRVRLREESKFMLRCRQAGVDVPTIFYVDPFKRLLFMERIMGDTVRDVYNKRPEESFVLDIADKISKVLACLHDESLIHGDLTTSNFIVRAANSSVVLIDFGLAFSSKMPEDKAVDLYVLERAFLSTHPEMEHIILEGYSNYSKNGKGVLKRLEQVRARGRKKLAFG